MSSEGAPEGPLDPFGTSAGADTIPQIYVACPLTGLDGDPRRFEGTSYRIDAVKRAIEEATILNRAEGDKWPIRQYIPFERSRPGADGGLSPETVYNQNFDALLNSDGLIVITDEYCSAGIGQEIEWAVRIGIPVLYLSPVQASRQIRGTPHNVVAQVCLAADDVPAYVRNWLTTNRHQIQGGPNRRADREFVHLDLMARLKVAWDQAPNRTALAYELKLHFNAVDSLMQSPLRIATAPWWLICELAVLLGVSLDVRRSLTFAESRAWVSAAESGGWDRAVAERVRVFALMTGFADLETPAAWRRAHVRAFGETPDSTG